MSLTIDNINRFRTKSAKINGIHKSSRSKTTDEKISKNAQCNTSTHRKQCIPHGKGNPESFNNEYFLNETLMQMKLLLLRVEMINSKNSIPDDHLKQRSQDALKLELGCIQKKIELEKLPGEGTLSREMAYTELSKQYLSEIEKLILTDTRSLVRSLKDDLKHVTDQSSSTETKLCLEIATLNQQVSSLKADVAKLETERASYDRPLNAARQELEQSLRQQSELNQTCIELSIQGLDYKAEVDRRCLEMLAAVQSRMGFVPTPIQQAALRLKLLKAPGDPAYGPARHRPKRDAQRETPPLSPASSARPSALNRTSQSDALVGADQSLKSTPLQSCTAEGIDGMLHEAERAIAEFKLLAENKENTAPGQTVPAAAHPPDEDQWGGPKRSYPRCEDDWLRWVQAAAPDRQSAYSATTSSSGKTSHSARRPPDSHPQRHVA